MIEEHQAPERRSVPCGHVAQCLQAGALPTVRVAVRLGQRREKKLHQDHLHWLLRSWLLDVPAEGVPKYRAGRQEERNKKKNKKTARGLSKKSNNGKSWSNVTVQQCVLA